jgi:hypothetical protein
MLVGVLALALLVGGCRNSPAVNPTPVSSPTVAAIGGPVAFHVRLNAGQAWTTSSPLPEGCPGLSVDVNLGGKAELVLVAYATTCPAGEGNSKPGNGRHGVYRTAADIPADRRSSALAVDTALGSGLVFSQPYYECTNSCHNYTEQVAVITLAQPPDKTVQTLTVYSPKGSVGLEKFLSFLRNQLLA